MTEVTLHHGDCLEILPTLEVGSVDAVITDPPYLENDFSYLLPEFERITDNIVLTPGKLQSFNWIKRKSPFWEYAWKCSGTRSKGGSACLHILFEPVLAYRRPVKPLGSDLLDFPLVVDKMANGHPWPKPLKLFTFLVSRWTNQDDTILDPFMGSGTTGVACVQTGRNFIGIEIDRNYYEIAEKRIKEAQLQIRMPI